MGQGIMANISSRRLIKYAVMPVAVLLGIYILSAFISGPHSADICAMAGLALCIGVISAARHAEVQADREIEDRIRMEWPRESQPVLLALYERLKAKERERLFQKVLDDSHGDLAEANKLTALAESLGWRAFLENHW